MSERVVMSIQEQADMMAYLVDRCRMRDGSIAARADLTLTADEVADLDMLAQRLARLAPHERAIRRVVTGR